MIECFLPTADGSRLTATHCHHPISCLLASRLQTHGGLEAAKLSPKEEATARSIFERSRTSQGGSEKGLKVVKFKGLMIEMPMAISVRRQVHTILRGHQTQKEKEQESYKKKKK